MDREFSNYWHISEKRMLAQMVCTAQLYLKFSIPLKHWLIIGHEPICESTNKMYLEWNKLLVFFERYNKTGKVKKILSHFTIGAIELVLL